MGFFDVWYAFVEDAFSSPPPQPKEKSTVGLAHQGPALKDGDRVTFVQEARVIRLQRGGVWLQPKSGKPVFMRYEDVDITGRRS